jgi:nitroreductase
MSLPMSQKMYVKYKYEKHLPYLDTGLALSNMILYAKSKGIDSCVFNLSEYHFMRIGEKEPRKNLINKIKLRLNMHNSMEGNFEFYLRKHLKIPEHLKIMCGVALGYAKIYPDIKKEIHGGKKVMREKAHYYIISH